MNNVRTFPPILRYSILLLILWNFPGFIMVHVNDTISSLLSYLSYGLIALYVVLHGKSGNNLEMILVGSLYFSISSLSNQSYMPEFQYFIPIVIKYFIIIVGGYEVLKHTSYKELWVFMLLGALSILGNMFLFNDPTQDTGRYSGFYLDPNTAGLICLMGFALSYVMPKPVRLFGKLAFTLLGLFTFSRTFIILWLLLNLLSIRLSIKNAKMLLVGFGLLSVLLVFNEFLPVKNVRLEQIGGLVSGNQKKAESLEEDSRLDTWGRYYDALFEKPIFGHGYMAFLGNGVVAQTGVHNFYLLLWGEAGIFPLLVLLMYLIKLHIQSNKLFKQIPYVQMMIIGLSIFMLTNHDFLTSDFALFILLWIDIQIKERQNEQITQSQAKHLNP